MKLERVSPHIWSLQIRLVIPIRIWLVAGVDGLTLVDAGLALMERGVRKAIAQLDAGELQRILLTHGHPDHTGAITSLRKTRPVPVFAHEAELPYLEGREPYPRRKKAAASVTPGLVEALPAGTAGQLEVIGGLVPYLAPGHSPGHTVYHHEQDDVLLAGDLFTSRNGRLRRPMALFTSDMQQAVASAALVGQLKPAQLEISHGSAVREPAEQLTAYFRSAGVPSVLN
jgi:glyoxylase-like metal-dependent hydrolase (beta-lactamase superfamily II)